MVFRLLQYRLRSPLIQFCSTFVKRPIRGSLKECEGLWLGLSNRASNSLVLVLYFLYIFFLNKIFLHVIKVLDFLM